MTDEPTIHECDTCGIRERAKEIAQKNGAEAAVSYRMQYCIACTHNPNMGQVKTLGAESMVSDIMGKFLGIKTEVGDHWIPIEGGTLNPRGFMKRCADCDQYRVAFCKVSDELNKAAPPDECPIVWELENDK